MISCFCVFSDGISYMYIIIWRWKNMHNFLMLMRFSGIFFSLSAQKLLLWTSLIFLSKLRMKYKQ